MVKNSKYFRLSISIYDNTHGSIVVIAVIQDPGHDNNLWQICVKYILLQKQTCFDNTK